jgi:4-hydroxy-tetrahydrodipicolinate reductase
MTIALIGYGKMGKAIEQIAIEQGHEIVLKISVDNLQDCTTENIQKADVAIEFTSPESAIQNLQMCIDAGVPVVCGSTGWVEHEEELKKYCTEHNGTVLFSSNFSIGVNIFFAINKKLAALINPHKGYDISITETHHTAKLDAPSGTAITIAQQILENNNSKNKWILGSSNNTTDLPITSVRENPAPGTHSVLYSSAIDSIEIIHTAHSRAGFAAGALAAAVFLQNKKGIYTMSDVLNIA